MPGPSPSPTQAGVAPALYGSQGVGDGLAGRVEWPHTHISPQVWCSRAPGSHLGGTGHVGRPSTVACGRTSPLRTITPLPALRRSLRPFRSHSWHAGGHPSSARSPPGRALEPRRQRQPADLIPGAENGVTLRAMPPRHWLTPWDLEVSSPPLCWQCCRNRSCGDVVGPPTMSWSGRCIVSNRLPLHLLEGHRAGSDPRSP